MRILKTVLGSLRHRLDCPSAHCLEEMEDPGTD